LDTAKLKLAKKHRVPPPHPPHPSVSAVGHRAISVSSVSMTAMKYSMTMFLIESPLEATSLDAKTHVALCRWKFIMCKAAHYESEGKEGS